MKRFLRNVLGGRAVTVGNAISVLGETFGYTGKTSEWLPNLALDYATGQISGTVIREKLDRDTRKMLYAEAIAQRERLDRLIRELED